MKPGRGSLLLPTLLQGASEPCKGTHSITHPTTPDEGVR